MKQAVIGIAIVFAAFYVSVCAMLLVFQRSLIYFPPPASPVMSGAKHITMPVDGERLLVTVREHSGSKALLYFGGNAEDVNLSFSKVEAAFPDHAIYMLHYRGYTGSTGKPSERALVADALALFDDVVRKHKGITVIGRSLGSGVAVQLASQRPVERLVLVTPYDSIRKIAQAQFPYVPVGWLLQDTYESSKFSPKIMAPTLLVAAERDEFIPRASTEALLRSFPDGVATLKIIPATGHNTISESPAYAPLLAAK